MASDDSLTNLLSVLGQSIIIVVMGILARKYHWIPEDTTSLSIIVAKVSLPAIFFTFSASLDISSYNWVPIVTIAITRIIMVLLCGFVAWIGRFDPLFSAWGVIGIFVTQSNDIALGIPIINALWDNETYHFGDYAVIHATFALLTSSLCIAFILIGQTEKPSQSESNNIITVSPSQTGDIHHPLLHDTPSTESKSQDTITTTKPTHFCWTVTKALLKNQLLLAVLLGGVTNIVCRQSNQNGLPLFFADLLQIISSPFTLLALFLMGIGISGKINRSTVFGRDTLFPLMLIVLKMVIFPVVARGVLAILWPYSGLDDSVFNELNNFTFIYGTLPPAITAVVAAQSFQPMPAVMMNGMLLSLILCAPYMFLVSLVFGIHIIRSMEEIEDIMNTISIITGTLLFSACIFYKKWRKFPMSLIGGLVFCQTMFSLCKLHCVYEEEVDRSICWVYAGNCFFRYASRAALCVLSIINALYRTKPRWIWNYVTLWKIVTPLVVVIAGGISALLGVVPASDGVPIWVRNYHTFCWLWHQTQFDFVLIQDMVCVVLVVLTLSVSVFYRFAEVDQLNPSESFPRLQNEAHGHRSIPATHLKRELGIDLCFRLQSIIVCELVRLTLSVAFMSYIIANEGGMPDQSFYILHLIAAFLIDSQGFITFLAFCVSEPFSEYVHAMIHRLSCDAFREANPISDLMTPSQYVVN